MIKRLIFDVDNVLIPWKDEYNNVIDKTLYELGINNEKLNNDTIRNAQLEWESKITKYDKQDLLEYINKNLNVNLTMKFIDLWQENLAECASKDFPKSYYETFKYLSNKYELVALTNWFTETQSERLKTANIYQYFKRVYGGEISAKPNKESFIQAVGNNRPEECAMIGDDLEIDILGAKKAGIKNLVWKDIYNKKEEYSNLLNGVRVIKEIEELKNIF